MANASRIDPSRLKRADAFIEDCISKGLLPGAITAVVHRGELVHWERQGYADLEGTRPLTDDALYRIYSITKIFTTVALLALYEDGAVDLNDPVEAYIPAFKGVKLDAGDGKTATPKRTPTVYDMLRHCGGLAPGPGLESLFTSGYTLESLTDELAGNPLIAEPGTQWNYGYSTDVVARIIEVVSGKSFGTFLSERVLAPLGLDSTFFSVPQAERNRLLPCAIRNADGALKPFDPSDAGESIFLTNTTLESGSAGLIASTADVLTFARMLLGNGAFNGTRILGRKTVEMMTMDHLPKEHPDLTVGVQQFRFGLGVSVITDPAPTRSLCSMADFGWGGAAGTQVWISPAEDLIALIMIQVRSTVPTGIMNIFKRLVFQALE